MKEKEFHYQWWGKGDIDASLGIFFDGFSKVLTAVGILTAVFGMPMADVIGKVVPGIGISIFVGNMCISLKPVSWPRRRNARM